jgi:hypothetical protein
MEGGHIRCTLVSTCLNADPKIGGMSQPVDISLRPSSSLSPSELDEIWGLTERYVDTSREHYEAKLLMLPEVGLWRVRGGELVGLVSLRVHTVRWEGRTRIIIFTSNVVADERFRGRNLVLKIGLRVFAREKLRRPFAPAYWFFDTFSYKSYLILARNLGEYWPRRDQPTPPGTFAFIDKLATEHYGSDWNRDRGIVRRSGHKQLRPDTAPIDGKLLSDPDVSYFEAANPGHREGDMLVCLAPLTLRNFWGAINRARR